MISKARADLTSRTVDELVLEFADICVEQGQASLQNDLRRYNSLFDRMVHVEEELKRRAGDQRRALLRLYAHSNMQVRLQAAKCTLFVAPLEARAQLEAIANSNWFPQAGDAGMSLWNLDRGVFKPT